jgi:YegS/Rv2252/BmrU family lipid kinase
MDDWFAVLNPVSGGGRGLRDRQRIEALLRQEGVSCTTAVSEHAGHALELARSAMRAGHRRFLAIGGDGTLNELLNGLFLEDAALARTCTLAIVPVGRGNDWARGRGIKLDYMSSIAILRSGRVLQHDVGMASLDAEGLPQVRYFLNVAGAGFDAHVVRLTRASHLGPLTYLAGLVRGFASYQPQVLEVSAGSRSRSGRSFLVFAAIGRYCGGGMLVAPSAQPDDGLFDAVIVGDIGKAELVWNLRRLFDGTLHQYHKVTAFTSDVLEVRGLHPVPVEVDGELVGESPVRFSMLPRAVSVLAP